ncbi:hypothetical protein [Bradyrhizobium uaiense]|uniref:Uncharacterized protein n=1 Tax=Bradyrhizobium uaiense TaxID=2594946 RepID=A0A6P1BE56_9BRAD|nr:hypothetical protein [Bradyrhizobium uaiense]NEU95900.1 hypothetical protein [Bradyrhizobium uaiense]
MDLSHGTFSFGVRNGRAHRENGDFGLSRRYLRENNNGRVAARRLGSGFVARFGAVTKEIFSGAFSGPERFGEIPASR